VKSLAIVGGAGRMGQALAEGFSSRGDFTLTALIDERQPRELYGSNYARQLEELSAADVDVVIDFSSPAGVVHSAAWCVNNAVALVVGTTGLTHDQRATLREASLHVGVVVAANFSVGAVLSERFAAMAAPYFERVEIVELHHDRKVDAPSGTSIATAEAIAAARASVGASPMVDPTTQLTREGARGASVDGVKIHSVRLAGLVAHQEVHFGSPGEGLTIRHDSFDRQSFVHGVSLAVNAIDATPCFLDGISSLLA
jgi:4-hydroxy-tetrahydrodipicolinate reductase